MYDMFKDIHFKTFTESLTQFFKIFFTKKASKILIAVTILTVNPIA